MYNPIIRLILILASLIAASVSYTHGATLAALLFFAGATLLVFGYWRYGSVWLAWRSFLRGDMERVERLISATPNPERLTPQHRAYYEWLQGEVDERAGRSEAALIHFQNAVDGRLRSRNDRAFAYSRLAHAQLTTGDQVAARETISKARALPAPAHVEIVLTELEKSIGTN